jgi:hypothetical protein
LAKPNYSFEKRQRELAKRNKKEDKEKLKAQRKAAGLPPIEPGQEDAEPDDAAGAPPAQPQQP